MNYYLGIDLGATNFKYGILDKNCRLKEYDILPIKELINPERAIFFIKCLVNQLIKKYNLVSIGFGLPGLVDYKRGYIYYLVNLKNWQELGWKKILEKQLNLPVFLDNDVNAATLAEYHLGAGLGCANMVMITLGTGVGGGLILSGKIYRGTDNFAGEIGHIPLGLRGPFCNCGGIACLESYIGNKRLLQRARYLLRKKPDSILIEVLKEKGKIGLDDISSAAKMADTFAVDFWKEAAEKLGLVLVGVINLLNPERIIIGGGVSKAGKYLFNPLREFVKKRSMHIQAKNVKILASYFKDKAGSIGAGLLAKYALEGKEF